MMTTAMTREEYITFTINRLKINAKNFIEAHYPELKEFFAERIGQNQYELVKLGYTWEQVEEMEMAAYEMA